MAIAQAGGIHLLCCVLECLPLLFLPQAFEKAIAQAGGIDLLFCGIGTDGHIARNEPGPSSLPASTS